LEGQRGKALLGRHWGGLLAAASQALPPPWWLLTGRSCLGGSALRGQEVRQ
jgi:hypothetical protein